jgi:hypothetical protein
MLASTTTVRGRSGVGPSYEVARMTPVSFNASI